MQFSIKTAILALAVFVPFAAAAAEEKRWGTAECKPLLQSCAVNSECCGDLCVAGVSILLQMGSPYTPFVFLRNFLTELHTIYPALRLSALRCSNLSLQ